MLEDELMLGLCLHDESQETAKFQSPIARLLHGRAGLHHPANGCCIPLFTRLK
jgi:hypothetical protein